MLAYYLSPKAFIYEFNFPSWIKLRQEPFFQIQMSLLIWETMQGFDSVMVDGSHLPFKENISYAKDVSFLAHSKKMSVEAELGRLSGTEDGLTVEDYEAKLTDVIQVNC